MGKLKNQEFEFTLKVSGRTVVTLARMLDEMELGCPECDDGQATCSVIDRAGSDVPTLVEAQRVYDDLKSQIRAKSDEIERRYPRKKTP